MTWDNPQSGCPLCEMERETHWYRETDDVVVADNFRSRPFVVWKDHTPKLSGALVEAVVRPAVSEVFGDHELEVRMNHVGDHWHAHVVDESVPPSEAREEYVV